MPFLWCVGAGMPHGSRGRVRRRDVGRVGRVSVQRRVRGEAVVQLWVSWCHSAVWGVPWRSSLTKVVHGVSSLGPDLSTRASLAWASTSSPATARLPCPGRPGMAAARAPVLEGAGCGRTTGPVGIPSRLPRPPSTGSSNATAQSSRNCSSRCSPCVVGVDWYIPQRWQWTAPR